MAHSREPVRTQRQLIRKSHTALNDELFQSGVGTQRLEPGLGRLSPQGEVCELRQTGQLQQRAISGRRPGQSLFTYLLLYSVARIVVELFRDDPGRGVYLRDVVTGGLSTGQIMSATVATAALAGLVVLRRRPPAGETAAQ